MPESKVEYVVNRKVTPIESFTVTLSPSSVINIFDAIDNSASVPAHSPEFRRFLAMRNEALKDQAR